MKPTGAVETDSVAPLHAPPQVWLSPDEVRDLPVPLLHEHAANLLSELISARGTR